MDNETFKTGDIIRFTRNAGEGDIGVVLGREIWVSPDKTVLWDGEGERPPMEPREKYDFRPVGNDCPRYLVRWALAGEMSLESTKAWRGFCNKEPHNYPWSSPRDMELLRRPDEDQRQLLLEAARGPVDELAKLVTRILT